MEKNREIIYFTPEEQELTGMPPVIPTSDALNASVRLHALALSREDRDIQERVAESNGELSPECVLSKAAFGIHVLSEQVAAAYPFDVLGEQ